MIQANEIKFVSTRMAGNTNSSKNKTYLTGVDDNNGKEKKNPLGT